MISKLSVGILVAVAALFVATPEVFAASSTANKNKIKKYFTQLKKLPNKAAPAGKVKSLVTKLTKLDPQKANKYYKTGLKKLAPAGAKAAANSLANSVVSIVKQSGLPASTVQKVTADVNKDKNNYTPPPPTPTPYVAMLLPGGLVVQAA